VIFEALANVRPGNLADPLIFDFADLVIGAPSPYTGPEKPLTLTVSGASTRAQLPLER
jgi:hypothetical protein